MDPARHVESGVVREGDVEGSEAETRGPVSCPKCSAYANLTDSECWRCCEYFSADAFDSQR